VDRWISTLFTAAIVLILVICSLLVYVILIRKAPQAPVPAPATSAPALFPSGMVAAAHPAAAQAGVDILKKNGNAIDAAVAAAFTLGVVEPFASGIGGGGFMLIYLAKSGQIISIDYRETAPKSFPPELAGTEEMEAGPRSVGIPGTVAGLALALKNYGTMDLRTVMEPCIRIASDGFPVNDLLANMMQRYSQKLSQCPDSAEIFLKNGIPYRSGERLSLRDLAATYRLIAEKGPDAFYKGELGWTIAAEMQNKGGFVTEADLAAYRPKIREPVEGTYRGYKIVSMGPSSSGGTHIVELLNVLEGYDMAKLGHNSAGGIQIMAEAMRRVFADRQRYMGDPAFVSIPLKGLLSKAYAESVRRQIVKGRLNGDVSAGNPGQYESTQTTHLSVADRDGNLVALTQTLNAFFGSGFVVPGTGILLNNEMKDFVPGNGPDAPGPGKRPVSSMSPTLMFKDGKPFLTIGMPGATRIISVLPQIIMNIIDYGQDLQAAIDAPRFHCLSNLIELESRIPDSVQAALRRMGYPIVVRDPFDLYFGGAQGILIDPQTGRMQGAADPRRAGAAIDTNEHR
jgi:gamma-glutamyltranspeptidase / glutathione hydrolase